MTMPSPADLVDAVKEQLTSAAFDWPTLNIIVEPGRSVIGNAGTFVTKVIGWKRNGNKKYSTHFCFLAVPLLTFCCLLAYYYYY